MRSTLPLSAPKIEFNPPTFVAVHRFELGVRLVDDESIGQDARSVNETRQVSVLRDQGVEFSLDRTSVANVHTAVLHHRTGGLNPSEILCQFTTGRDPAMREGEIARREFRVRILQDCALDRRLTFDPREPGRFRFGKRTASPENECRLRRLGNRQRDFRRHPTRTTGNEHDIVGSPRRRRRTRDATGLELHGHKPSFSDAHFDRAVVQDRTHESIQIVLARPKT